MVLNVDRYIFLRCSARKQYENVRQGSQVAYHGICQKTVWCRATKKEKTRLVELTLGIKSFFRIRHRLPATTQVHRQATPNSLFWYYTNEWAIFFGSCYNLPKVVGLAFLEARKEVVQNNVYVQKVFLSFKKK